MTEDRRVRHTKERLHQALVSLLGKKPVEEIDVTELCRRADISRSSFYFHYTHLGECLAELEENFLTRINDGVFRFRPPESWDAFSADVHRMLDVLWQERETFLALNRGSATFMDRVMEGASRLFAGYHPERWTDRQPALRTCAMHFVVHGMMRTIRFWLEEAPELPREAVAALILEIVKDGYWHTEEP